MMGTATFGIIVRTMLFNRIQTSLGLMPTAIVGALMGTVTYAGYSLLTGTLLSRYLFFVLAGMGTVGSTFSGSSVASVGLHPECARWTAAPSPARR